MKEAIEGANPPELNRLVRELVSTAAAAAAASGSQAQQPVAKASDQEFEARLAKLTSFAPVMLFMKGTLPLELKMHLLGRLMQCFPLSFYLMQVHPSNPDAASARRSWRSSTKNRSASAPLISSVTMKCERD